MKKNGSDIKKVRGKIDDKGKIIKKIEKDEDDVEKKVYEGENIVDNGFENDNEEKSEKVEMMRRKIGRIDEREKYREEDIN